MCNLSKDTIEIEIPLLLPRAKREFQSIIQVVAMVNATL
jgi:hypothetical protein